MKTICLISEKGGVAKTTSSVNLCAGLAMAGKRCLLVDLDTQAHSTMWCGVVPNADRRFDSPVYSVLVRGLPLMEYATKTGLGFDLLAGARDLASATVILQGAHNGRFALKNALAEIPPDTYDVVLCDCPPALGIMSRNALVASTGFLVPTIMQGMSVAGLATLLETVEHIRESDNPELAMIGVLECNSPKNSSASKNVRKKLISRIGEEGLFVQPIRYSEYLSRAFEENKPIQRFVPGSIGCNDYTAAVEELLLRGAA